MPARKVVLATFGTHGDLNPFIAIALRLREQGFEPVIATTVEYEPKVAAAGIAFRAVRPSMADVRKDLGMDDRALMERAMADPAFIIRRLSMPYLRVAYDDMVEALSGASLVMTSTLGYSARLAAEQLGIPYIGVVLQPMLLFSAYDPPLHPNAPRYSAFMRSLGPRVTVPLVKMLKWMTLPWVAPVKALRRELGMPEDSRHPIYEGQYSPDGVLGLYSPLIGSVQRDHPSHTQITGFAFYDEDPEDDATTQAELAEFLSAGPPPLAFVLGSIAHSAPGDFFDLAREIAETTGRRAVLVAGANEVGGVHRSANVLVCRYVPYSRLFPQAAAIIHQGGIGTLAQALRSGRPQIVVPFHGDQLDNGARAARLGVGRVILRSQYRKPRVIRELETLLNEPSHAAAAATVGEQIRREDGATVAAAAVERVLASQWYEDAGSRRSEDSRN